MDSKQNKEMDSESAEIINESLDLIIKTVEFSNKLNGDFSDEHVIEGRTFNNLDNLHQITASRTGKKIVMRNCSILGSGKIEHYYHFIDCEFDGQELELLTNPKFTSCQFPYLVRLKVKTPILSFDSDCQFNQDLNLDLSLGEYILPSSACIRSAQLVESEWSGMTTLVENGSTTLKVLCDQPYINPINISYTVKYGEYPEDYLDKFELSFDLPPYQLTVKDSEQIVDDRTFGVYYGEDYLGELLFHVEDDPLAKSVLEAESELIYDGNVPEKWYQNSSLAVKNKFNQLSSLCINGDVESEGFEGANLHFDQLEIQGTLRKNGLGTDSGQIGSLIISKIEDGSFNDELLKIEYLEVHEINTETDQLLSADHISLSSSKDFLHVNDTQKLTIRNSFDSPIDVSEHNQLNWIDFQTVEPGSYKIYGWTKTGYLTYDKPTQIIRKQKSHMQISDMNEIKFWDQIFRLISHKFPTIDYQEFTFTLDNDPIEPYVPQSDGFEGKLLCYYGDYILYEFNITTEPMVNPWNLLPILSIGFMFGLIVQKTLTVPNCQPYNWVYHP